MGFAELALTAAHAGQLSKLPTLHKDPFDRMLLAQSLVEPLTLLTNDATLARYGAFVTLV